MVLLGVKKIFCAFTKIILICFISFLFMLSVSEISSLPNSSGCYLFKDECGRVLYVGKAKNLKKRVSSYFQKKDHDTKTALLVTLVKNIDFIVTETEAEALLLENNLIKLHSPKFNLDLKDSRRYAYLRLSGDELPILEVARTKDKDGEYFGPFTSGAVRKIVMDTVTRHFRILYKKPSPQLRKILLQNKEDYLKRVAKIKKILNGNVDELIKELESEMKRNSEILNYEYALTLRNQIEALKTLKEKQVMEFTKKIDSNAINYSVVGWEVYLLVFNIRSGVVEDRQEFVFDYYEGFLGDFLMQFYDSTKIPNEILIPQEFEGIGLVEDFLSKKSGKKVRVLVPKTGDKKELLDFVKKNITATFFVGNDRTNELQKALGLEKAPRIIECFDISHLSGKNTVASMVTFVDGFSDKSNYRRFRIRSPTLGDDLQAIREAVRRRYLRVINDKLRKPDLIVIDGGPTQLGAAMQVLGDLKLKVPIISIAKQFEEIYISNKKEPIRLSKKHKGLQLLQAIRDEAHRFANAYRKILQRKELVGR